MAKENVREITSCSRRHTWCGLKTLVTSPSPSSSSGLLLSSSSPKYPLEVRSAS
jgi:hypothetical protein